MRYYKGCGNQKNDTEPDPIQKNILDQDPKMDPSFGYFGKFVKDGNKFKNFSANFPKNLESAVPKLGVFTIFSGQKGSLFPKCHPPPLRPVDFSIAALNIMKV